MCFWTASKVSQFPLNFGGSKKGYKESDISSFATWALLVRHSPVPPVFVQCLVSWGSDLRGTPKATVILMLNNREGLCPVCDAAQMSFLGQRRTAAMVRSVADFTGELQTFM